MSTRGFIGTLDPASGRFRARFVQSGAQPLLLGPALTQLVRRHRSDLPGLLTLQTGPDRSWSRLDPTLTTRTAAHDDGVGGDIGIVVPGIGVALPGAGAGAVLTGSLDVPCPEAAAREGMWGYLFDSPDPDTARLHLIRVTDRFQDIGHVAVEDLHRLDWTRVESATWRGDALPAPLRSTDDAQAESRPAGNPVVQLGGPAELLAALPVLLGFPPVESLVVLSTGRHGHRRIGLTVRVDLPDPSDVAALSQQIAAHILRDDRSETAAVVIVTGLRSHNGPPRADLAAAVTRALEAVGIEVHTQVWASAIATGASWECYGDCECRGLLDDPATSLVAAEMVSRGRLIYADRSDLARLVAATPEAARRTPHATPTGIDLFRTALAATVGASGSDRDLDQVGVDLHEHARAATQTGTLGLDERLLRGLAAALARPRVRDAVLIAALTDTTPTLSPRQGSRAGTGERGEIHARERGIGDLAPGNEMLWAALSRELPNPDAADPAVLLAAAALARGDGVMANVALDRAEQASPQHRLTALLREAAALGMPPSHVRAVLLGP